MISFGLIALVESDAVASEACTAVPNPATSITSIIISFFIMASVYADRHNVSVNVNQTATDRYFHFLTILDIADMPLFKRRDKRRMIMQHGK